MRNRDRMVPEAVLTPQIWAAHRRVSELEIQLSKARFDLAMVQRGQAKIKCGQCGHRELISGQEAVRTHWYTRGNGHGGGDYWNPGEFQWHCPSCRRVNRWEGNPGGITKTFYRPVLTGLVGFFKAIKDKYND